LRRLSKTQQRIINKKKEGGIYASKARLFLNEYDGIPLEEFCKAEKVILLPPSAIIHQPSALSLLPSAFDLSP